MTKRKAYQKARAERQKCQMKTNGCHNCINPHTGPCLRYLNDSCDKVAEYYKAVVRLSK